MVGKGKGKGAGRRRHCGAMSAHQSAQQQQLLLLLETEDWGQEIEREELRLLVFYEKLL